MERNKIKNEFSSVYFYIGLTVILFFIHTLYVNKKFNDLREVDNKLIELNGTLFNLIKNIEETNDCDEVKQMLEYNGIKIIKTNDE